MKKFLIMFATAILIATGFMVISGSISANADEGCVPSDAWTEVIEHEAVTHEETVHHPAETKVVHHGAATHLEWRYAKYTHTKTRKKGEDWSEYGPWTMWEPMTHVEWHNTNVEALGSPQFHGQGTTGHGRDKIEWYREWQLHNTGKTRVIVDREAYDEVVVIKEAWDEVVVITDQEAWTETIEHPAVECPADEGDKPDPIVETKQSGGYVCGDDYKTVTTSKVKTDWVLEDGTWVKGEPEVISKSTKKVPVKPDTNCGGDEDGDNPDEPETPDNGTPTRSEKCLAGSMVVKTTDADGNISTSIDNASEKCQEKVKEAGTVIKEEGM